jgi:hypothetical protein
MKDRKVNQYCSGVGRMKVNGEDEEDEYGWYTLYTCIKIEQ